MTKRRSRKFLVETLEDRRVLAAGSVAAEFQLLAVDPSTGGITSQNGDPSAVSINRHPDAISNVVVPFLSGDFNNDTVDDLLALDQSSNTWWLQLNDGTQLFEVPVGRALLDVQHLGTADVNHDQRLDVVSFNAATNELVVSLNLPSGFDHQTWGELPAGIWSEMYLGDFDDDGHTDVLAGETDGSWQLARNLNGNSFSVQTWGQFPDYDWVEVVDGDFDGDNVSDIVALAPDSTWWLWRGGAGGFGGAEYFGHWKLGSGWKDIGVGDFSGDGTDDVIGRTPDGRLWVGTATANGFATWVWGSGWLDSAQWSDVTIVDVDGDGTLDQLSKAIDGTWWYAKNNDNERFSNFYWQSAGDADFIVANFAVEGGVDIVDTLPPDGIDLRELRVSAGINERGLFELTTNNPIQIDAIDVVSPGGSLIPPGPFGPALTGASATQVQYGPVKQRLEDGPLALTVGLDRTSNESDVSISVAIDTFDYRVHVAPSIGPAVTNDPLAVPETNQFYFDNIPAELFRNGGVIIDEGVSEDTRNTIALADAKLTVALNEQNEIVITAVETLQLVGLELRSSSGSLLPVGGGGVDESAEPFLEFLANSAQRIIYTSQNWPLQLSGSLTLDASWSSGTTSRDLVVEYRLAGDDSTTQVAYVSEPLRLPFVGETETIEVLGGQRVNTVGGVRTFFGSARVNAG